MKNKKLIIAIDGYSSCGKSTAAKSLAKELNYTYIDSGAMYRAFTLYFLRHKPALISKPIDNKALKNVLNKITISFKYNPQTKHSDIFLNGENVEKEIRSMEVSDHVSEVSKIRKVREKNVALQRQMGKGGGIVMDGRDIGTVVFPDADLKIFMTARPEVRAERRYKELVEKGVETSVDEVRKNIEKRDYIDSHREITPLRQADDAVVLDNSHLTLEQQHQWLIDEVKKTEKTAHNC